MSDKMRSVNTRFWDDSFIQDINPTEKLLFLYLLTNPLTNILGIYEISLRRISFDTGLNKEIIQKGLERFERVRKVYYIDEFIILPNFLKNQKLNSNMKVGVSKIFNELPNELKHNVLDNEKENVSNDSKGFEMVLNSLLKYEIEIESEKESEIEDKKITIPEFIEFKNYVLEIEPNINIKSLEYKYNAWKENNWKDGNNKKIKNWKTKISNTLQYLEKDEENKRNKDGFAKEPSKNITTKW